MMGAIIASAVIVGNRVGRMEEQLAQIVKHLDQGEQRMDNLDQRISEHETRLGRLEPAR
jgi:chromosome segregation ATPase